MPEAEALVKEKRSNVRDEGKEIRTRNMVRRHQESKKNRKRGGKNGKVNVGKKETREFRKGRMGKRTARVLETKK